MVIQCKIKHLFATNLILGKPISAHVVSVNQFLPSDWPRDVMLAADAELNLKAKPSLILLIKSSPMNLNQHQHTSSLKFKNKTYSDSLSVIVNVGTSLANVS